jgi:hypothetical protein
MLKQNFDNYFSGSFISLYVEVLINTVIAETKHSTFLILKASIGHSSDLSDWEQF